VSGNAAKVAVGAAPTTASDAKWTITENLSIILDSE
jgi:hypothetical protein